MVKLEDGLYFKRGSTIFRLTETVRLVKILATVVIRQGIFRVRDGMVINKSGVQELRFRKNPRTQIKGTYDETIF